MSRRRQPDAEFNLLSGNESQIAPSRLQIYSLLARMYTKKHGVVVKTFCIYSLRRVSSCRFTVTVMLILARLMGQYCFAGWRLSSSVTLPAGGRAGRRAWRVGGRVADTAWRASTVTSCNGDTLLGLGLWLVLGLGLELDFSTWKEWDFTSASRYVATTFHKTNAVHVRYPHVVYFPSTLTGWSRL